MSSEPQTAPTSQPSDNSESIPSYLMPELETDKPEQPATDTPEPETVDQEPEPEPASTTTAQPIDAGGKKWQSAKELADGYTELSRKLGEQGRELGELRRITQTAQQPPTQPAQPEPDPFADITADALLEDPQKVLRKVADTARRQALDEARRDPQLVAAANVARDMQENADRERGRKETNGLVTDAEADAADEEYFRDCGARLMWRAAYKLALAKKLQEEGGQSRGQANDTAAKRIAGMTPSGEGSAPRRVPKRTEEDAIADEIRGVDAGRYK